MNKIVNNTKDNIFRPSPSILFKLLCIDFIGEEIKFEKKCMEINLGKNPDSLK